MDSGEKLEGAFLSIGEVSERVGVPTHVLRYWETRFTELKPLQRAGRRRYYRPEDVALAEQIHDLLHRRGFTVDGARRVLAGEAADDAADLVRPRPAAEPEPVATPVSEIDWSAVAAVRDRLTRALAAS